MEYTLHLDDSAREDLLMIASWIARDSPREAQRWLARAWDTIHTLGSFPARCPLAPEAESLATEVRHLVVGDYRVLFRIAGCEVRVLRIRHGARRPLGPDAEARGDETA